MPMLVVTMWSADTAVEQSTVDAGIGGACKVAGMVFGRDKACGCGRRGGRSGYLTPSSSRQ